MNNHEQMSSQIIDDLDEDIIEDARACLSKKLKANSHEPSGIYKNVPYYILGDTESGYIILADGEHVIYFVRYRSVKANGLKFGRQVLVWSHDDHQSSVGFARFAFFNLLLPKYHALVADQQQTERGRRFWRYSAEHAFENNKFVYFLDRRSTPNVLTEMTSDKDIVKFQKDIWGTTEGHKRTFLVISDKPVSITRKL